MAQVLVHKVGRAAQGASVDVARHAPHIVGILVAPRRRHLEQHSKLAWHHQVAGRGGRQHEPPAARALLKRELLRQRAAPGHAQDVNLLVSQLIQQPGAQPRQRRRTVRQDWRGLAADAGHIEDDRLGSVEHIKKGFYQFDIGSDPVEEKERRARPLPLSNADAQHLPSDVA